jgi:hypothetical protein
VITVLDSYGQETVFMRYEAIMVAFEIGHILHEREHSASFWRENDMG